MEFINVHYAVQTCDGAFNVHKRLEDSPPPRFHGVSKPESMQKCITSLFESIEYCIKQVPNSQHTVMFFDDNSSQTLSLIHI